MQRIGCVIVSIAFVALLSLASCVSVPKIPAKGEFFGETVNTTVDSAIARYYLESYLRGRNDDFELDARIAALYTQQTTSVPSREDLKTIAQTFSVDFASLFLADRLLSDQCNRKLNHSFLHYLKTEEAFEADLSSYVVLFVPGWDYAETGHLSGADFAQPRRLATAFGIDNELVKLPPRGSVEENADVLVATIRRHSRSGKSILLAGASSAGPAIHLVLGEKLRTEELHSIKAWLNLSGLLQGSPLIDFLQVWPQRWVFNLVVWFKGWDKDAIFSMGTTPSRERFQRLQRATDILTINYVGIPLSGQISQYSKDQYPLLSPEGPNDGLTLLTDAIAPNSRTIVALGQDHFLAEDPKIDQKTVALMKLITAYVEQGASLHCS